MLRCNRASRGAEIILGDIQQIPGAVAIDCVIARIEDYRLVLVGPDVQYFLHKILTIAPHLAS